MENSIFKKVVVQSLFLPISTHALYVKQGCFDVSQVYFDHPSTRGLEEFSSQSLLTIPLPIVL